MAESIETLKRAARIFLWIAGLVILAAGAIDGDLFVMALGGVAVIISIKMTLTAAKL